MKDGYGARGVVRMIVKGPESRGVGRARDNRRYSCRVQLRGEA